MFRRWHLAFALIAVLGGPGRAADQPSIRKAEDRLRWAEAMHEKGHIDKDKVRAERAAFLKAHQDWADERLRWAESMHKLGDVSDERFQEERMAFDTGQARRDRLRWAEAMHLKGYVSEAQVRADRRALLGPKPQPNE